MNWETIYQRLPICLQNAACSAEGWRIQHSRFGPGFRQHLEAAERRIKWSEDRLLAFRDQRIRDFVKHCAETVPYYQRLFREHGIDPTAIRTHDDLSQLPVLTKAQVQRCYSEMLSTAVPRRQQVMVHSSGTTGGGLRFATTLNAIQQQWAVWERYRRWHGIEFGTWCAYFGGRSIVPSTCKSPPFWRYNYPGRQIFFSGYHISSENLPYYVEELRRRKPPWIHGYPSMVVLVAAHLLDTRGDLGYQVKVITGGAENLLPQQSDIIERAFGIRPRQHYGMAEAVANMSECEKGMLHVDEDFAAVEFVPNPDDSGYRVIGTNFTNPATPLLRYDSQDIVTLLDGECSCGRPGRVIRDIDGRREDYVVLANGIRVGRMDHVFKDLVNIREAQIHQKQVGAITIRVVRGSDYTPTDEQRLLRETRQRIGSDVRVVVEYVDQLERTRTGKLRFVVSELEQGQLAVSSKTAPDPSA